MFSLGFQVDWMLFELIVCDIPIGSTWNQSGEVFPPAGGASLRQNICSWDLVTCTSFVEVFWTTAGVFLSARMMLIGIRDMGISPFNVLLLVLCC